MSNKRGFDGTGYTIGQMADIAGVSARALRHYEDMGLITPTRSANGYRVYGPRDAKRLGHILAMRACGLPLDTVGRLLKDPEADVHQMLDDHLRNLRAQALQLRDAMARTKAALATVERIDGMKDKEKFEELKRQWQEQFEEEFGAEARERHGDRVIDETSARMMALSHDEWDAKERLEKAMQEQLRLVMGEGDPRSEDAVKLARMHEQWIRIHWGERYSRAAHLDLVRHYMTDSRYRSYYDGVAGDGALEFLIEVLEAYLA